MDPATTILQVAAGAVLPRCLHAVANMGVADAIDDMPLSADMIAAATGTHPEALARALRLLAANGVFEYRDGLFAHSPASRLLRSDHPQSMRQLARMFGLNAFWSMVGDLEYSIRTGLPAADHVLKGGVWGYLSSDPEASRVFDDAMTGKAHGQVAGVIAAYDFSSAKTVAERERLAAARVNDYMDRLLTKDEQFVPIQPTLESALHAKYDYKVNAAGVDRALERAQRIRAVADSTKAAQQPPSAVPLPGQPGAAPGAPAPAPDTTKKPSFR